ncbi:hypothetical protein EJ357_03580 [Streptomyces cyaneochromogenes]|uniref:Uncharacterized protein n=1 Tax=Streptomyces cyaneochromogenes TaxID=2496836 RepID=A0A3Q9EPJ8_9ACTN|nr:hypothetical protein [Streptomyces cyaneochromogenes]AZQ32637.1 hypothetical protein EJ357_03580 [Streptomyces cyaneochromogenes]
MSPFLRRKALRHVQANPGRTADELMEMLSAYDRSLFGGALRSLRECRQARVDTDGRIWPA